MTQEARAAGQDTGLLNSGFSVSRREFLKKLGLLGGGIIVYFTFGDSDALARARREGFQTGKVPADFNAFLSIGADGKVSCRVGKIEMGQGVITSFAQMMAEELDVPYDDVQMLMGDTDLCPWDAGTWGSLSTRVYGTFVREAASEAKGVLKELASDILACPVDRLTTKDGMVFDRFNPVKRVGYGRRPPGSLSKSA
jgi:isoquinoline 1-oxidoreductase